MRDNVELQIEMINNKIERLKIQKEFYEKILSNAECHHSPKRVHGTGNIEET